MAWTGDYVIWNKTIADLRWHYLHWEHDLHSTFLLTCNLWGSWNDFNQDRWRLRCEKGLTWWVVVRICVDIPTLFLFCLCTDWAIGFWLYFFHTQMQVAAIPARGTFKDALGVSRVEQVGVNILAELTCIIIKEILVCWEYCVREAFIKQMILWVFVSDRLRPEVPPMQAEEHYDGYDIER